MVCVALAFEGHQRRRRRRAMPGDDKMKKGLKTARNWLEIKFCFVVVVLWVFFSDVSTKINAQLPRFGEANQIKNGMRSPNNRFRIHSASHFCLYMGKDNERSMTSNSCTES